MKYKNVWFLILLMVLLGVFLLISYSWLINLFTSKL